ncbi:MAG: toll/interleukin-1 receptor domain-containing protein [Myxococcota bacterium]
MVCDAGDSATLEAVRAHLQMRCEEIRLGLEFVERVADADVLIWFQGNRPTYNPVLNQHLAQGMRTEEVTVIPVVQRAGDDRKLPSAIQPSNALVLERLGRTPAARHAAIVDRILMAQVPKRVVGRVFLSYKRDDATAIAQQLCWAFQVQRYHVFLDEWSVGFGTKFQREIEWHMSDTDLVVLLVSPQSGLSHWILTEVGLASGPHIGVVGAIWPEVHEPRRRWTWRRHAVPEQTTGLANAVSDDLKVLLAQQDIERGGTRREDRLTDDAVERIIHTVFANRARAQRVRLESLIDDVHRRDETLHHDQPGVLVSKTARHRVFPFRPSPAMLHHDHRRASGVHTSWYYQEIWPGDPRAEALQWLASSVTEGDLVPLDVVPDDLAWLNHEEPV